MCRTFHALHLVELLEEAAVVAVVVGAELRLRFVGRRLLLPLPVLVVLPVTRPFAESEKQKGNVVGVFNTSAAHHLVSQEMATILFRTSVLPVSIPKITLFKLDTKLRKTTFTSNAIWGNPPN